MSLMIESSMSAPENERPGEAQGPANAGDLQGNRFQKGVSGNPQGRVAGSRNKASLILDALAEDEGAAILKTVIGAAKGGDLRAAEILLSRLWPPRRGHPIRFDLPPIRTAADVTEAVGSVMAAVADGTLTPTEGAEVAGLVEGQRKAIETAELVERIERLEQALGDKR